MNTSKPPKINCTQCGECCRGFSEKKGVILFPKDIKIISHALELSENSFCKIFCCPMEICVTHKTITIQILKHKNGSCIFLEKSDKCQIHEFKPIQCRRMPLNFFWNGTPDYYYKCLNGVIFLDEWSSEKIDAELMDSLLD